MADDATHGVLITRGTRPAALVLTPERATNAMNSLMSKILR